MENLYFFSKHADDRIRHALHPLRKQTVEELFYLAHLFSNCFFHRVYKLVPPPAIRPGHGKKIPGSKSK